MIARATAVRTEPVTMRARAVEGIPSGSRGCVDEGAWGLMGRSGWDEFGEGAMDVSLPLSSAMVPVKHRRVKSTQRAERFSNIPVVTTMLRENYSILRGNDALKIS